MQTHINTPITLNASVMTTIALTPSEQAHAFACWAQTHSLSDISVKSARLLHFRFAGKPLDAAMSSLAALSMVNAVFYDPHYSSMRSKRARILSLIDNSADVDAYAAAAAWVAFKESLACALLSDFVSEERTIHNACFPFCEVVETLFGRDFIKDIQHQSVQSHGSARIISGFDLSALAAINSLTARFTQARLREEIFRESATMFDRAPCLDDFERFLESLKEQSVNYGQDRSVIGSRTQQRQAA